ncbi:transglutaminase-like domain-containing protein [Aequorivita sp. F47161]|uniref:Transglutaminase-like domain-containing protein n=1 Tax=Aequorivita vitellina TaxID=2874475 RepID=A0A9X1U1W9_9FLAO|nr:transglutaminase-like domain-containing protein [Aequorivita vitellina]MCG2420079.1 transglutaminase-like domain-containing protein [Aequorivita vitellina]
MKSFSNALILLFFAFFNFIGFAQDFQLKSKLERIEIQADSSFVKEIAIVFKKSDVPRLYPIIYDTELEQLTNVQLFEQKGRRLKELSVKNMYEEAAKLDYITSKKIKIVEIPADIEVKLTYLISCKELMYFSSLQFFSYDQIDTLNYEINVPLEFKFTHNTIYQDSLSFFAIDSISTNTGSMWNIKVAPKKVEPDPLQFFGIYKNMKVPFMRTLVMPSSYNNQPINYMNDWYFKQVAPKQGLSVSVKEKIDALTANTTDPSQIVNIIYNYVKSNFKYVAIEIGMGAFIPSHVNEVYLNKQGDCKDLSNLLSEALKYKGIDSHIALAATFDHISDCDFPSLSSANHVIAIAYINDETVLLDPTDPIHVAGTPVQSLQDRTVLIVSSKGGSFYKVKGFSPQQNEIFYALDLKIDSNDMNIKGTFNVDYNGLSSNYLRRILKSEGEKEFANYAETFYDEIFGNQLISDLTILNQANKLHLQGNIAINGKTFNDDTNKYLFIDFLPRLIETERRETLIDGTYLHNPYNKKVLVNIKLDQPVETFNPIEHTFEGEGISLNVTQRALSNLEIEISYDFIFDHIFIDKENISKTNEILESFKKIINAPIVLKIQKS